MSVRNEIKLCYLAASVECGDVETISYGVKAISSRSIIIIIIENTRERERERDRGRLRINAMMRVCGETDTEVKLGGALIRRNG